MKEVRTRFAPSPTGFQHVGGFRTAFYAWLIAKHNGGKFLLRIEDTDQERRVAGAARFLIDELAWFGIPFDEGPCQAEFVKYGEPAERAPLESGPYAPYFQSQRLEKYKTAADWLVENGFAYRCDCTPQMLERERNEQLARKELPGYSGYCRDRKVSKDTKHVVRFRIPLKKTVSLQDAVKGKVTWDSISLRDPILLKSEGGFPTYHLASVVDDHDMQISHVTRADEWLASAPLHIMLYEAFGWEPPIFAHLPNINGTDGKKLSKRKGAPSTDMLREQGYLPEAVLNYVVLIGWSPGEGEEQELFSREELIQRFTLERINNASGIYDPNKLNWMNGMYIRKLSVAEFVSRCQPFLKRAGIELDTSEKRHSFEAIAPHVQERVRTLAEVAPMVEFLFNDSISRDIPDMYQKGIDQQKAKDIISQATQRLEALAEFRTHEIETLLRPLSDEMGLKAGPVFGVLRIAVTGKKITPPLFESFAALGKERTISRLRECLALIG